MTRTERVIYLASRSPQRAKLLTQYGVVFQLTTTRCREDDIRAPVPQALAVERARAKAREAEAPPGSVVLGADTVVALGMTMLGSPADAAENRRMLVQLSGTTHQVHTAHCLVRFGQDGKPASEAIALTSARVTMRPLSAAEIDAYIASGEGLGKAGGYAIQEKADRFVVEIQGATETVVGLHVWTVAKLWREIGEGPLPGYTGPSVSGPQKAIR